MQPIIQAIILCLIPISELRGGIPYALANGIDPLLTFMVCVLANIVVIPIVFIFLTSLHHLFYKIPIYKRLFDKLVARTRKKAENRVKRYGYWGIMLFVAIPLPITGAYTGTLAAWILGLNKKKAFLYLSLGVLLAGIIVSTVSILGISALGIFTK